MRLNVVTNGILKEFFFALECRVFSLMIALALLTCSLTSESGYPLLTNAALSA